uniref:Uncharacterized protein n=1 Tax=Leersia perrieri TaxID=77586 RepID=A0A0D9WPB0_9ORYZ
MQSGTDFAPYSIVDITPDTLMPTECLIKCPGHVSKVLMAAFFLGINPWRPPFRTDCKHNREEQQLEPWPPPHGNGFMHFFPDENPYAKMVETNLVAAKKTIYHVTAGMANSLS